MKKPSKRLRDAGPCQDLLIQSRTGVALTRDRSMREQAGWRGNLRPSRNGCRVARSLWQRA